MRIKVHYLCLLPCFVSCLLAQQSGSPNHFELAMAGAAAMSTARSQLRRGRVEFQMQASAEYYANGDKDRLEREGSYRWDVDAGLQRWSGTESNWSGMPPPGRSASDGQHETYDWFRTKDTECIYRIDSRSLTINKKPADYWGSLEYFTLDLDLIWFSAGTAKICPFDEYLVATQFMRTFDVEPRADGTTFIGMDTRDIDYRSEFILDSGGSGLVKEYWLYAPEAHNWFHGTFDWQRHESGVWYPARAVLDECNHADWDTVKHHREFIVKSFDPDPGPELKPERLRLEALDLPIGTHVAILEEGKQRSYIVGGRAGDRANFESRLRETSGILRSGFAAPERAGAAP